MKLVREYLYEHLRFTENGDAIHDMGIGVDGLIHKWMREHNIPKSKYRIGKDKKIIADDTVMLSGMNIGEFPEFINFAHINGGFHCDNSNITSLRGCPRLIQGAFFCSRNFLKDNGLIGGPQQVEGSYAASSCGLKSLEGIAFKIEEDLYIDNNSLYSLEFIPKEIQGSLYMAGNPIRTLDHFPTNIYGDLHISRSKILNELTISEVCSVSGEIFEYN